jgi:hypothetical protein
MSNRTKLRQQLRRSGVKIYGFKWRAVFNAIFLGFYQGGIIWVEKHPAGYIVWNKHILKTINKSLMEKGSQKIRERDIKKVIVFKF